MKARHYTQFLGWDSARWPKFTLKELSCRHCGEYYHDPDLLDRLQRLRDIVDAPLNLRSAHRCRIWNHRVGGASRSQHKKMAVDIALDDHDPKQLRDAAKSVGFRGFGFYNTFLHLDMGRGEPFVRVWPRKEKRNKQWL